MEKVDVHNKLGLAFTSEYMLYYLSGTKRRTGYRDHLRTALGALAQLGERIAGSDEVRGSIPLGSTRDCSTLHHGSLAQLVEHVTLNHVVQGSSP